MLESLKYPMFETTEQEKELLREARKFISAENSRYFLCRILRFQVKPACAYGDLILKIREKLGTEHTLTKYLGLSYLDSEECAELRRIWIDKLLEYKGE